MNYDILDENIPMNDSVSKWFIPFAVMLFLALPLSFLLSSTVLTSLMIIAFAIGIVGNYFDTKPVHDRTKVIGEVHINKECIKIKYGQTIIVKDIKSIFLHSDGYRGMTYSNAVSDSSLSGIAELKLTDHLNETTVIRFLVKSPAQFSYLKDVIRTYYISKISIKETFHYKMQALLLAPLKTYAENQALKKELGLQKYY